MEHSGREAEWLPIWVMAGASLCLALPFLGWSLCFRKPRSHRQPHMGSICSPRIRQRQVIPAVPYLNSLAVQIVRNEEWLSFKPLCLGVVCYTVTNDQFADFLRSPWFVFNIRNTGVGIDHLVRRILKVFMAALAACHAHFLLGIIVLMPASLQLTLHL